MGATPLSAAQHQATLDALRKHGSQHKAAHALKISRATFVSRLHRAQQWQAEGSPLPERMIPSVAPLEPLTSFEEAWARLSKAIGMARDRYKGPPSSKAAGNRIRLVGAGDFHVPFHNRYAVAELIARESKTTDLLVLGGDFGDAAAASTFTKYEPVTFRDEMAETVTVSQALSESFRKIHYLRGSNHMDRVEKRLRERLDPELVDAILYMTGGELSPDVAMMKRYPNVTVDCWVTPSGQRVPWLMVVGDVAFSHAEKYSRVPGAALRSVDEWLTDFSGALGLPEIRAVVQFHTHAMSLLPWKADKVLVEPGCMCDVHHYQLGSRIAGRPQRLGYVVMELENGRVDFDSIKLRWLNRGEADTAA